MKRLSTLLSFRGGDLPVTGGFPHQNGSIVELFCFFDLTRTGEKRTSYRWFETPWHSCDVTQMPHAENARVYFRTSVPLFELSHIWRGQAQILTQKYVKSRTLVLLRSKDELVTFLSTPRFYDVVIYDFIKMYQILKIFFFKNLTPLKV